MSLHEKRPCRHLWGPRLRGAGLGRAAGRGGPVRTRRSRSTARPPAAAGDHGPIRPPRWSLRLTADSLSVSAACCTSKKKNPQTQLLIKRSLQLHLQVYFFLLMYTNAKVFFLFLPFCHIIRNNHTVNVLHGSEKTHIISSYLTTYSESKALKVPSAINSYHPFH